MRLELAPFGIKTISVITGAVTSLNHTHYESWKLPEDSLYSSVQSDFEKRAKGDDGAPRMAAHDYAERVVSRILAGSKPKLWYGASASIVKFAVAWFPTWWLVCVAECFSKVLPNKRVGFPSCEGDGHRSDAQGQPLT